MPNPFPAYNSLIIIKYFLFLISPYREESLFSCGDKSIRELMAYCGLNSEQDNGKHLWRCAFNNSFQNGQNEF
ncbi:hypothetical protein P872_13800 [Rhodonellum psychrophilum GCM71 = DSM 17998]|uniref:Uncharacterized protein n=2 Tax=Rhodonellum TaxID=336827 RepID=U5BWU1_9BACT|nr:hypothetical protein P872_13800 [Rhodonellum psychrophilum GCM71 = DSM 17998]SDY39160.1 hypothetical protein SAMN05444412_1013 [Rhodonellum ikkaensis]